MIGFVKLNEGQVAALDIGMQVFIKLTGDGWSEIDREDEGLYHVGMGHKLWSEDCNSFYFTYEMNQPAFEYEVYIPDMKYKLNNIIRDVKEVKNIYKIPVEDILDRIRKAVNK